MIQKDFLKKGLAVELITPLPGRPKGLSGIIDEIESVDYDIVAIWISWNEIDANDRFDVDHEPSVLNKLKISDN